MDEMKDRGFDVISIRLLRNNVCYLRINVTDIKVTLLEIMHSLLDSSWISSFFPKNNWERLSIESRVQPTIDAIAKDFNYGIDATVNRDTGEKLVSEMSRRTLVEYFGLWSMPLSEFFKQKIDGNPGFDFLTVELNENLLLFGEAKYEKNGTPYISAMTQIKDFIFDGKDKKDLYEIAPFMPNEKPLDNVFNNIKGYVAAFSTHGKSDDFIIDKVIDHNTYSILTSYSVFIVIAVDL